LGILKKPPRTDGGYRSYPPEALDRVRLIRNAVASGFTLRQLTTILQVRDGGGAPCRQVAELAREKVLQLEIQIAQLTRLRDSLKMAVREWDRRLKQTPDGGRARLLESLFKGVSMSPKGENHASNNLRPGIGNAGVGLRSKRDAVPCSRAASGEI